MVSTSCHLFTEFALRPVAAQALEAGHPPRRFAAGIMGRIMVVWLLGSGVPLLGVVLAAVFALSLRNMTLTQFAVAVLILGGVSLLCGLLLMWIVSWITATPVRVVRAALKRVEQGDFRQRGSGGKRNRAAALGIRRRGGAPRPRQADPPGQADRLLTRQLSRPRRPAGLTVTSDFRQ